MNQTFELKDEKADIKNQLENAFEKLKNVSKTFWNVLVSPPEKMQVKAERISTDTLFLLKTKLEEFKFKEQQLHRNIEFFFQRAHRDERYNLYFLSYHLLLKKLAEIAHQAKIHKNQSDFLDYLKHQPKNIQTFFQHTVDETKHLEFWGKELLHDLIDLIEQQVAKEELA